MVHAMDGVHSYAATRACVVELCVATRDTAGGARAMAAARYLSRLLWPSQRAKEVSPGGARRLLDTERRERSVSGNSGASRGHGGRGRPVLRMLRIEQAVGVRLLEDLADVRLP